MERGASPFLDALFRRVVLVIVLMSTAAIARSQTREVTLPPFTESPSTTTTSPNPATTPSSATTAQPKPMTVDDVIRLSKAGLNDDLIIEQITKKGQRFELSTDQLLELKAAHVSDRVIETMLGTTPAVSTASSTVAPHGEEQEHAVPSAPNVSASVSATKPPAAVQQTVTDLAALVGKAAIVQRMPLFELGTYKRISQDYAGQKATIIAFKPFAFPKVATSNTTLSHLPPEQRAIIADAKHAGTLVLQFADGTKADTGMILPSMLSNYLELTEPLVQSESGSASPEKPVSPAQSSSALNTNVRSSLTRTHVVVLGSLTDFIDRGAVSVAYVERSDEAIPFTGITIAITDSSNQYEHGTVSITGEQLPSTIDGLERLYSESAKATDDLKYEDESLHLLIDVNPHDWVKLGIYGDGALAGKTCRSVDGCRKTLRKFIDMLKAGQAMLQQK